MNALVVAPHDEAAIAELERMRREYVEMYEFAAAMALDETTAQVGRVRRNMRRRLARAERRVLRLEDQLRGESGSRPGQ